MTITTALHRLIDSPFLFLIFAIGVHGWWRLLARDTIFDRPRNWFYSRWPHEGFVDQKNRPKRGRSVFSSGVWYTQKGTWWGELLYCPYCSSWWIAGAQFGVYLVAPRLVIGLALAHTCRIISGLVAKHA